MKDAKSVAGFSPSLQIWVRLNNVTWKQPDYQVQFQNVEFWASLEVTVYRIADTLKAKILVTGKGEWLLFWKRLKRKLLGVTCSFKERCMRARDKYSYSTVLYKIDMAPWTIVMAKHYDYGTVFEVYIWMTLRKTCSLTATFSNTLHKNI